MWWRLLPLLVLCIGCGPFDDDLRYQPHFAGSVLAYTTDGPTLQLGRYTPQAGWQADWHLPLNIATPLDAALWDERLWVLSSGQVHTVRVQDTQVEQSRSVPAGVAAIYASEERFCLLDTQAQSVLLAEPDGASFAFKHIPVTFTPRSAAFLSGKWVVAGETAEGIRLAFLDEGAAAVRSYQNVAADSLKDLQAGPFRMVLLTGTPGTLARWEIDPAAETVSGPTATTLSDAAYTPYLRAFYGSEYTQNVELRGGTLQPFGRAATTFNTDFLGSQVYLTDQDSLYLGLVQADGALQLQNLVPFTAQLAKGWHVYTIPE